MIELWLLSVGYCGLEPWAGAVLLATGAAV